MSLKKLTNRLLLLLLSTFFIMPFNTYAKELLLGGENIGIEVKSNGILVVGFYKINKISPGEKAGLMIGDRIIEVNNKPINEIAELSNNSSSQLDIKYIRNNVKHNATLSLIKDNNNYYKTGIYVKDSIVGIGTLTFIDPETKKFAALGHEIIEKETGKKFEIKEGNIFSSSVTSIEKGTRNNPGSKNASINYKNVMGTVLKNEVNGIYGIYSGTIDQMVSIESASNEEIVLGPASIRTVLNGTTIREYEINIIKTNAANNIKNIVFEVTDKDLLIKTNGIIQGMSGSPIIQNKKLIGAVTHVVIDNSRKGYGIFVSNMLEEANN